MEESPVQTDGSSKLYKLNATSNRTGLEFVIKVMAGDKIDIFGKSYYLNTTTMNNANSTALDVLSLMTSALAGPGNVLGGKGITASQLNGLNSGLLPASFIRGANGESTTVPKAYINYIFLDEQFRYAGGGASRVGSSGSVKSHWSVDATLQNIAAPKNGYIFVYVSNESNVDVFFDNLQVIHKPGMVLEETHYYPFGLTMAGISSKALTFGGTENKKKYQQYEFNSDLDINLYESFYRTHDAQIGRFLQIDPKPETSTSLYSAMGNNPVLYGDLLGDTLSPTLRQYYTDATESTSRGQKGKITRATKQQYEESPGFALTKDISFYVFELLGINAIDDAIDTYSDPNATTVDIFLATVNVGLSTGKIKGTKLNGKITEPSLPDKLIGEKNGVEIVHYTKSGDHGPAHVHVNGGGKKTKVGQNGKPLKGAPELTPQQKETVEAFKKEIRKTVKQIMSWFNYNNK